MEMDEAAQERFWSTVDRRGDDECWPWLGQLNHANGYGQYRWGRNRSGAHRIAWTLVNGPVPAGNFILHRCDVPRCCNPAHLWAGTPKENTADMFAKGRNGCPKPPLGSGHHNTTLNEWQVCGLMADWLMGVSQAKIAARLGIVHGSVSRIVHGGTWGHLFKGDWE